MPQQRRASRNKPEPRSERHARPKGPEPVFSAYAAAFDLDMKGREAETVFGAAYLLTDRAFARFDGDPRKRLRLTLRPKTPEGRAGLKSLAETFLRELEAQEVRWRIARNNLPVREFIVEKAVALANAPASPPPPSEPSGSEALTDEQRLEIEKLIAEVEEEIRALGEKKPQSDPKNISASWEEKHPGAPPQEPQAR